MKPFPVALVVEANLAHCLVATSLAWHTCETFEFATAGEADGLCVYERTVQIALCNKIAANSSASRSQ